MIGTQSRLPCRDVQLGEAVLLKKPVSPQKQAILFGKNFIVGGVIIHSDKSK